jgi:hypothetical protein
VPTPARYSPSFVPAIGPESQTAENIEMERLFEIFQLLFELHKFSKAGQKPIFAISPSCTALTSRWTLGPDANLSDQRTQFRRAHTDSRLFSNSGQTRRGSEHRDGGYV